jgi:hypothetical protein
LSTLPKPNIVALVPGTRVYDCSACNIRYEMEDHTAPPLCVRCGAPTALVAQSLDINIREDLLPSSPSIERERL